MTESVGAPASHYAGLRMTADEYFDLGETEERYELVNGVVMMSPSPSFRHQNVVTEIVNQLYNYLRDHSIGKVVPDIDVDLGAGPDGGDIVYRPDAVFLRSESLARIGDRIRGVIPDLVVEIISPMYRRYDLETKKNDYERVGVGEYWVIDPERNELHFWRLNEGRYEPVAPSGPTFTSQAVPGFTLDLARVRTTFVNR